MSSPLSSLKKGRKTPLLPGRRAPYKKQYEYPGFENSAQDQVPLSLSKNNNGFSSSSPGKCKTSSSTSDAELMSSMMHRLAVTEKQLREEREKVKEKERRIKILEEKCYILEKARGQGHNQVSDLEQKCDELQNQVHSMEKFLADYGMMWVGEEEGKEKAYIQNGGDYTEMPYEDQNVAQVWKPDMSHSDAAPFNVDYDLILQNIEELNVLAGEGEHVVAHTISGARLKVRDPIPLLLYANGIFMFKGPFRPFTDKLTQQCIQDLMDGYFPAELYDRYPDGVPFAATDMRDTAFRDKRHKEFFPGNGQSLVTLTPSQEPLILRSVSSSESSSASEFYAVKPTKETSEPLGVQTQSIDQFLKQLPPSVIKDGKIVDVRSGIAETLKGAQEKTEVVVLETEETLNMNGRLNTADEQNANTSSNITTLRVKSETGNKTFILKMKYKDTIKDLRKKIDKCRSTSSVQYQIKTCFPNQTYDNTAATLEECGLVPNAALHLLVKKK